jgi:hypothetical protein
MPGLVPDAIGQGGGIDPLGMINQLTEFQLRMNQNRQFQAQFMANQALGEAMAHAPSLQEGLDALQQSPQYPLIAGFATQGLENYRAMRQLELQGANISQEMSTSGYKNVLQAGLASMNDPMNYDKYFTAALQAVDPMVRDRVKPMVQAVEDSIGQKLSGFNMSDLQQAAAARSAVSSMIGGAFIGAGGDPSHLAPFLGQVERGPQNQPGVLPGIMQMQNGTAPTGSVAPPPTAVQQSVNPVNGRTYPIDNTTARSYFMQNPDGSVKANIYGQPIYRTDNMAQSDKEAQDEFNKSGPDVFESSRNMYSSLTQLEAAERDLSERGGFQVSGFLGKMRGQVSNLLETMNNMGVISLDKAAETAIKNQDIGEINKQSGNLIFSLKNSLDPGARSLGALMEAATVVPGMDNTPLQFMTLTAGLKGLAAWKAGEYQFKNDYLRTNGTLQGADAAYAAVNSPLAETKAELNRMGMDITADHHFRFLNDDAAIKAFSQGLLGSRNDDNLKAVYVNGLLGQVKSDKAREIAAKIYDNMHSQPGAQ